MSAYPLLAKKQMIKQKLKMAMSLKSKNRHYHWHEILLRHWLSMAEICQFDVPKCNALSMKFLIIWKMSIGQVSQQLPENFPQAISQPIFENMRNLKLHALKSNI